MRRAFPLPARFVLLVLVVVAAPLALIGYWLVGTAARSGEDLLRSRLRRTNESVVAELANNWNAIRSALLTFAEIPVVQEHLTKIASLRATPTQVIRAFEALPAEVLAISARAGDDSELWQLTRGSLAASTFNVEVPVYTRLGEKRGTLDVQLLPAAVLGPEDASGAASGAVVAVLDRRSRVSLRPLPLDPMVLSDRHFQWAGETWVAEHRSLAEPPLDVVSAAPLAEFAAPFEAAAARGLSLLIAVALLASALAAVLTRRMTQSLSELARAADAVTSGNLAVHLPANRRDEVGRVAEAFNGMTASLRRTLTELSNREALAHVGGFAAELAHEIRNPLTSIKVDLQQVEERLPERSELRDIQRAALDGIERLDRTVSGVLQIARSGRVVLEAVDLRDPLCVAVRTVDPLMREAGATLRVDVVREPLLVRADPIALQQLFTNLLANAGQALGPGGLVEVGAASADESVTVSIRDNGRGIAADQLGKVMEPFYSTRPDGTGLGLAIANRIATAHGAQIHIQSDPGIGTCVVVRLRSERTSPSDAPGREVVTTSTPLKQPPGDG